MRRILLKWVSWLAFNVPYTVVFLALILTGVSAIFISRMKLQTDVLQLLPDSPEIRQYRETLKQFGAFDYNLVVLETYEPKERQRLIEAAELLARSLNDRHYILDINYRFNAQARDFFSEPDRRIINLLTEADWDQILQRLTPISIRKNLEFIRGMLLSNGVPLDNKALLEDPLDLASVVERRLVHSLGPLKANLRQGYYISGDGRMLVLIVKPVKPPSDLLFNREYMRFLRGTRDYFFNRNPEYRRHLQIHFIGPHVEMQEDAANIRQDVQLALLSSFVLVIGLFIIAFKRMGAVIFVGVPLILGLAWTMGFAALVYGRLTSITLAFTAVMLGLAIDFAIHIYNRFVQELNQQRSVHMALEMAIVENGRGLISGALTTAIAFYGLIFTQFRGFKELGVVAGTGILLCLASMLLVLPSLIVIRESFRARPFATHGFITLGLHRVAVAVAAYPRLLTLLGMIITAFLAHYGSQIQFDADLSGLKQPPLEYREIRRRVAAQFELPACQIIAIVSAPTLEEALQRNDRLYDVLEQNQVKYEIVAYDSLRTLLPSVASQRKSQVRIIQELDFIKLDEMLRVEARDLGLSSAAYRDYWRRLRGWQDDARLKQSLLTWSMELNPITIETVQRYIYHDQQRYRVVTYIYPGNASWRQQIPAEFKQLCNDEAGPVQFTGAVIIARELENLLLHDLARVMGYVLLGILLILLLHFKKPLYALVSMIPVMCSLIWMLGIMRLLNIDLNFMNIIAIPMVAGLGIDDGIYIMQCYYEREERDIRSAILSTGRAVTISSFTTMLSFGCLLMATFSSVREMGLMCVIGVGCALFASLLLLPAMLWVMGEGMNLFNLIGADPGREE
ncbi:MMPL family transporter [Candidatus Sumerlaeota bacterium]|nr:MMPL family transporter [Candidatus Sumerlaeota bacterium]